MDILVMPTLPKYSKPREAAEYFSVSLHTLRRWEKEDKIQAIRTPLGQRRYDIASYTGISDQGRKQTTIADARVSSRGQKADLDRQTAKLLEPHPRAELITDIASRLNFQRSRLRTVLERVRSGDVESIVVAHKARLSRCGFDLIQG